jgi:hydrogenase maturation factor
VTEGELANLDPQFHDFCGLVDGCLVCGDVAVPVIVVEAGHPDAICEDAQGHRRAVGVELVSPVRVGSRLLVHGGVAISSLGDGDEIRR